MSVRTEILLLLLLLVAASVVSVSSMRTFNETTDEVPHIAAAYSYLHQGDFRLNVEHPPLIKEIAALPLLTLPINFDETSRSWQFSRAWDVGREFLYSWNRPEEIVFRARLPMIGLYLSLGVLVWSAARSLYGPAPGLLALFLALFTPELIAHGWLVTTDLGMALFTFATLWTFYRALLVGGKREAVFFCLSCGALATTKFTAPLIFLILLLLAVIYLLCGGHLRDLPAETVQKRLRRVTILALSAAATTMLMIWAVYGFRYAMAPDVEILVPWDEFDPQSLITRTVLLFRSIRLLPEAYLAGILECFRMLPDRPSYLFGQLLSGGHWYYFPVTFLLKTPLPLLILLVVGAFRRRRAEWLTLATVILLLPPALYLLVAMQSDINIGNRHILPIYPFLILWAAEAGRLFSPFRYDWRRLGLALLLLWLLIGDLRIYPDFLSYFNEAAGGASGGSRYLADSNIDWGQDLKRLAAYRKGSTEDLYLCYFGTAAPQYYLPDAFLLPCRDDGTTPFRAIPGNGLVAISLNNLKGLQMERDPDARPFLERLNRLQPIDRIGYSIYLYRLP